MQPQVLSFDMGSRNLAFALVEYPTKLLRWGMIDLGKNESRTASHNLVNLLESPEYDWMRHGLMREGQRGQRPVVVVELQPRKGVPKTLSHCLQTYFHLADLNDGMEPRPFHFMHANNKLKYDMDVYDRIKPSLDKHRKEVTMTVTEALLKEQSTLAFSKYYAGQKYKQKTDLADAFVQGCRQLQVDWEPKNRSRKRKPETTALCEDYEVQPAKEYAGWNTRAEEIDFV